MVRGRRRVPVVDAGLAALVAAAVVVISAPRIKARPVWLDEAYTVGATADLVTVWRRTGATQALYYLLIWPVAQLTTDRLWLRLPSLVFAAATVAVVYEIGRRIGGRRMGVFAAGLTAVSWALSRFAIEARSYSLALLLVSLSWLGLVAAVQASGDERTRRRWWALFVTAALLAPLAHGLSVLHVGGQLVALALAPEPRQWVRRCLPLLGGLAIEGVLLFTLGAGEVADWVEPLNKGQVKSILRLLLVRDSDARWVMGSLAAVAAVLVLAGMWRRPRTESWPTVIPVLWAFGAPAALVTLSVARPYGESRYLLGALPGIALLIAGLLARIRPAALAFACWVPLLVLGLQGHDVVTGGGIEDWPAVAAHIATNGDDGDRLLMEVKLRPAFDYAWERQDDPPALVPLSPTDPLGDVHRFYDDAPGSMRDALLAGTAETTWYIDRDFRRIDDVMWLAEDPGVRRRYEVTGPLEIDRELYVVRFEPRT